MQQIHRHAFESTGARPTASELLRADIDEFAAKFKRSSPLIRRAQSGELSPDTFGRYLRSIHYLLCHTPIHLSLAEERAMHLGHVELAKYFAHKRGEEDGHDRWAEADISAFARTFRVAVPDEPTPAMRAIVDANDATIRTDPFLYLAYVLFAEYSLLVLGPEWITAVGENCGIPASFMTAVGNHVELDRNHVAEGCAEIDGLVEERQSDALRAALAGMTERFSRFCDGLCDVPV